MALHEVDIWNRALSRVGDARLVLDVAKATVPAHATATNPVVISITDHGYSTGDLILMRGFDEMTEINDRVFQITVITAFSFELDNEDGTSYTAETTGGTAEKLPTTKNAKACFDAWENIRDEVLEEHPWNRCVKRSRLARLEAAKTITGATQADPVVITSAAHGYSNGDEILIEAVLGMTELNDRWFEVANKADNTFELASEDGTTHGAYTSGGTAKRADTPFVPDSGYGARYTMPTDALRILELVDSVRPWTVEGREVHTDEGDTVPIRYIFRQRDVTAYRPALVSVLGFRLALELMEELTQSNTKRERSLKEYQIFLAQAKRTDAQEQSPMPMAEDDWVTVRL